MGAVNFETDIRESKLMLRFENVSKSFGDKQVFDDLNFEIRGKEKVWLFGPNGAGKSTMVKLIMGEMPPSSGEITLGENIKIGYFAQKQTHLDYEKDLLTHFMDETNCAYGKAFGILGKFLFDKDAVRKKVKNLSPGERARFAFAIFAYNDYDLLILDEPTNHLDIETKEIIEKSLSEFEGTLILVSHDRYFVESVGVNKLLNLKEGELELY
jgi:ATP-binding cassette subfamily F protein 3